MTEEEVELKEYQLCYQSLPKEQLYKRKDKDGEPKWTMSYCCPYDAIKASESRSKKPEYYKKYRKDKYIEQN